MLPIQQVSATLLDHCHSPDSVVEIRAYPLPDQIASLFRLDKGLIAVHTWKIRQSFPLGFSSA